MVKFARDHTCPVLTIRMDNFYQVYSMCETVSTLPYPTINIECSSAHQFFVATYIHNAEISLVQPLDSICTTLCTIRNVYDLASLIMHVLRAIITMFAKWAFPFLPLAVESGTV